LHYLKLPLLPRAWVIFVAAHLIVLGAAWGAAALVVEAHGGYMSATGSPMRLVPMRPLQPLEAVNSKRSAKTIRCHRVQVESSVDQDVS
jgi:hypothetical protein